MPQGDQAQAAPVVEPKKSMDKQNITLKEYAKLDKESRLSVARHFAQTNAGNVADFIARIKMKNEPVPAGSPYMDTQVDVSRLPTDTEIEGHLVSRASEIPNEKVATEANRYCAKRNNAAITSKAVVKK